jgi:uncharacterized protein (TIGR04255 family)
LTALALDEREAMCDSLIRFTSTDTTEQVGSHKPLESLRMARKEVDFTSPPVNEVVFGIVFERPTRLLSAHFGAFWSKIRTRFPSTQDQLPLISLGDTFDPNNHLSRVWFISNDGRRLIQLQHDRFYYNWRRLESDASDYPEYVNLYKEFSDVTRQFRAFLAEERLTEELNAGQFELSYINMLERPTTWETTNPLGNVLVDHRWNSEGSRFLDYPRDFSWTSVFEMPNQTGQLIVEAKSGRKTEIPEDRVIQLTLTAKSQVLTLGANSIEGGAHWFETAHEQIVKGFADITDPFVQKHEWGRK